MDSRHFHILLVLVLCHLCQILSWGLTPPPWVEHNCLKCIIVEAFKSIIRGDSKNAFLSLENNCKITLMQGYIYIKQPFVIDRNEDRYIEMPASNRYVGR